MFKLESYVTPLILTYVSKYVKNIRPEDSQLSLWGGDAVFNNLDLRLDVLEQELNIPFSLVNGHIHELRIHVPWTKLTSEPVVITINTIECVLRLRDGPTSSAASSTSSSSKPRRVSRQPSSPDGTPPMSSPPPPGGYLGSLLRRVLHNVTVVLNNVILKYAEDDLVLSLNIKAVEMTSANGDWQPAFIELTPENPVLRKLLWMHDVTVCLDKRDSSGKIEAYQDPLLYRCFLEGRVHLGYDPITVVGSPPSATRCHFYCQQLDFSLTDQQLPLFLRLLELCLALYYGQLSHGHAATETSGLGGENIPPDVTSSAEEDSASQGWGSWAWSMVPQILPAWEEEDAEQEHGTSDPTAGGGLDPGLMPYESTLCHFGCYVEKLTCIFKTSSRGSTGRHSASRSAWRPLLSLHLHGVTTEMTMRGITWLHFQLGVVGATVSPLEYCACGFDEGARIESTYLRAGVASGTHVYNYLSSSLFDPNAPENRGLTREPEPRLEVHAEQLTELAMAERFPAFCLDYLYELQLPEDWCDYDHELDASYIEKSNWKEQSLCRSVIGPFTVDVTAGFVHRLQHLYKTSSLSENRPPYAIDEPQPLPFPQPYPAEEHLESMADFVPTRTYRLTLLKPTLHLWPSMHSAAEAASQSSIRSVKKRRSVDCSWDEAPASVPVLCARLECLDISLTRPMYPAKMSIISSLVDNVYGLPDLVKHHSFCHLTVKVFGFGANLVSMPRVQDHVPHQPGSCTVLMSPTDATLRRSWAACPQFLEHHPRRIRTNTHVDLEILHIQCSRPALMAALSIALSWSKGPQIKVAALPLVGNTPDEGSSTLEAVASGLKWSHTEDALLAAHTFNISSVAVKLRDKGLSSYLLHAPEDANEALNLSKIEPQTVNSTCSKSWLEATLQVSRCWNSLNSRPNFAQLKLRGMAINFDPALEAWLSHLPKVNHTSTTFHNNYFSPTRKESGTFSVSDELSGSSLSGSQKTRRLSESHATSPPPQSVFSPAVKKSLVHSSSEIELEPVALRTNNFKLFLLETYHHLRTFSVQVCVGTISIVFPKTPHLFGVQETSHIDSPSILLVWKKLAQVSRNCQVSCALLPAVTVMSSGSKAMWNVSPSSLPLAELPDSSSAGDKFPWTVQLSSLAAFESKGTQVLYALKPSSLSCTVALSVGESSEGAAPGATRPQLRLCVHLDVQPFHLSLSKKQVDNVGSVVRFLFAVHHRLLEAMAWFNHSPVKQDIMTTAIISSAKLKLPDRTLSQTESEEPNAPASVSPQPSAECSTVAFSLWMQWTLPKFGLNLFGKEKPLAAHDVCVQLEVEEVTASLDIQEVYSKAKLKLASFNVSCLEKSVSEWSSSWVPGPYEGVILSSSDKLTRHIMVLGASRMPHKVATPSPVIGSKGKPMEFLNFTWTQALRAHVRRNVHKSRKDFTPLNEAEQRAHSSPSTCYLSEVDLQMSPLDIVARASIISLLLDISQPVREVCQLLSPIFSSHKEVVCSSTQPVGWDINSSSLPLCYVKTGAIRVFLPLSKPDFANNSWQGLDTCLLRIGSVLLSPQVENPLSRRILREDLFLWAQEHRLLATLGSSIEDRQYQLDLSDFSVSTLTWSNMVVEATAASGLPCTVLMGENPAFEWNCQPSGVVARASQRPVPLTPICSSCDLRAILAPAIVAPDGDPTKKALVCAHSIEASIACDLHCYLSLEQLYLLHSITLELASALKYPQLSSQHSSHHRHPTVTAVLDARDSGLESDLSLSAGLSSSIAGQHLAVQRGQDFQPSDVCFVPFDILLTARMVSLTLGSVEKAPNEPQSSKLISVERDHTSSVPSDDEDDDLGYDASVDSDSRTETGQASREQSGTYRRPKVIPLARMAISHPHAFVSCSPQEQKVEVSCFDLQVSGSPPGTVVQGSSLASIESGAIFSRPWLETRPGEPDLKTGIPPSFFTVSVQDFLTDLVHAKIKVERPFKVNLNKEMMNQTLMFVDQVLQQVLPQPEHFVPSYAGNSTSTKPAPDSWRLVTTVETVQAVLMLDFPFVESDTAKLVLTSDGHSTKISIGCAHLNALDTLRVETTFKALQLYALVKAERCDLFGPTTLTLINDTFWDLRDTTTVPHCMLRLLLDALPLSVGPLQLHCCRSVVEHVLQIAYMFSEFLESFRQRAAVHSTWNEPTSSPKTAPAEHTGNTWHDDLRKGSFQYIQDYGFPNPNEIVFCRPSERNPGMMTWRYQEQRVLTRVDVYPVPFSTSHGDSISGVREPARLDCDLQFWDPCQEHFTTYQRFALSECTPHSLQLPQASRGSEHLLVVSDTWRVVLLPPETSQDDAQCDPLATVSPLALAACMRVDSHFDPCLVPLLRANITVDLCKVTFNVPPTAPAHQFTFHPFILDSPPFKCLEFMSVTFEKLSLSHIGWHYKMNMEACASVSSEVTEFLYLTSIPFVFPVHVQATVDMCYRLDQEQHAEASVIIDRCFLKMSQSVVHTLSTAATLWKKDALSFVPAYVVVCNDIQEDIRFGQVETDENILLQPGHSCTYSWRTHKRPRLLRFSVESQAWKWSTPFSPSGREHNSLHLLHISRRLSTVGICIKVKRNQGVETQVVVSGQVMLRSHLINKLCVRLHVAEEEKPQAGIMTNSSPQQKTVVGIVPTSNNCSVGTSIMVNPSSALQISIQRETNHGWSAKINVQKYSGAADWAEVVEIPDLSIIGGVLRVWCYAFKRTDHSGGESMVLAFAPLYVMRSHLPYSLLVHLNKCGAGDQNKETLQVQGRCQDHFLSVASPSTTTVTFQLGPDMKVSSPPVHLDPPELPVPFAAPPDIVEMLWDPSWPVMSHPDPLKWPYHNTELNEKFNSLWESGMLLEHCTESTSLQGPSEVPETELKVVQLRDPRSPFLGTIIVDMKPWAFLVNECGCSLHLLTANQGNWVVHDGQVFTPPVLRGPFHFAMEEFKTLWKHESPLTISAEVLHKITKQSSLPKATSGVRELTVGELTEINIIVGEGDTKSVRRLVIDASDIDGCLILTIRCAIYIMSQIQMPVRIGMFAVSDDTPYMEQWTGKSPILSQVSLPAMCGEKDKHSVALLKWDLLGTDQCTCDPGSKFFLTISKEDLKESHWSLPIMLGAVSSSSDERHTTAVPTRYSAPYSTIPLVLTTHKRSGVLYVIVHHDSNPLLKICNATNVSLQFAEASDEDGSSLQPFLSSLPSGCSAYFTPPRLNRLCSTGHGQDTQYPTLYFAHLEESVPSEGDGQLWSSPIVCASDVVNQFVRIPNLGDVRVSACKVGHTTDLLVESVSRAEISAKEVRSRIGSSGAVKIGIVSEHSASKIVMKQTPVVPSHSVESNVETQQEADGSTVPCCLENETSQVPSWARILNFVSLKFNHTCFILSNDDMESDKLIGPVEILRLIVDDMSLVLRHSSAHSSTQHLGVKYELFIFAGTFQLDNQLAGNIEHGVFDFPVVIIPQEARTSAHTPCGHDSKAVTFTMVLNVLPQNNISPQSVLLKIEPLDVFFEDGLFYRLTEMWTFFRLVSPTSRQEVSCSYYMPSEVLVASVTLVQTVHVREVTIESVALRLSIHASLKLFLSLNGTPLNFSRFNKTCLVVTWYQLGHVLTRHYVTGALFRAGWVVGSLDLLGNPAGLLQAISSGVSALVVLPFRGLAQGRPMAFLLGVTHGATAMLRHISSGALSSVTHLATSLSRNLDRMTLDSDHLAWKEELRTSSSQGFGQGLTTLGLSILGAIAGIVDHPLRALIREEERSPAGFVKGVGKGLIGVVAKPIGGAAELVAQTGKGILRGAGWGSCAQQRYAAETQAYQHRKNSDTKLRSRLGSSQLLLAMHARHVFDGERSQNVILVLTTECLSIFNEEEDSLERSFSVAEVTCVASATNPSVLILGLELQSETLEEEPATRARVRVAEYVTKASQFSSCMVHEHSSTMSSESLPGVTYRFSIDPKLRTLFHARVNEAKRMALGKGFGYL